MTQYKHNTTGDIVKQINENYYICSNATCIPKRFIENSNDWQKVEEVKYEVGKWYRNSVGLFHVTKVKNDTVFAYGFCRERWAENESFPIKKYQEDDVLACEEEIANALIFEAKKRGYVKGVNVGTQKINCDKYRYYSDSTLYIHDTEGVGICIFNKGKWAEIIEYKNPLFTTADGKDIFEGDTYYFVFPQFTLGTTKYALGTMNGALATFSTKEKSEEYILLNKPLLSLNDLLSVWGVSAGFPYNPERYKTAPLFKSFEKLAQSKL